MKGVIYYISKLTLLDELLGFAYWALCIVGLILFIDMEIPGFWKILGVGVYIPLVAVIYIAGVKKVKAYFRRQEQ